MTFDDPAGPLDDVDVSILDDLARIHGLLDPPPPGLVERSLFSVTLAALETEMMEIVDVASDAAGVRSADPVPARTITFTSDSTTVMITYQASGLDNVRLDGWIAPPGDGIEIELHTIDGTLAGEADQDGRFSFPRVPHGPVSLIVRSEGSSAMSTPILEV